MARRREPRNLLPRDGELCLCLFGLLCAFERDHEEHARPLRGLRVVLQDLHAIDRAISRHGDGLKRDVLDLMQCRNVKGDPDPSCDGRNLYRLEFSGTIVSVNFASLLRHFHFDET